ncbi:MAG: M23 family metallopeptidase [Bellilinea sp.]
MIETLPPLPPFSGSSYASLLNPINPAAASSRQGDRFQSLLGMMLMSGGGLGTQSSGMGSDLLTPLMLLLLEKLLSHQDNAAQSIVAVGQGSLRAPDFYTTPPGAPSPTPWGLPVSGRLTQKFHASHNGLDFGIPVGTPVRTTMDGQVVYAGWNHQGYGNLVIVENGAYRTYYAHLSSIPVSVGQQVTAGTVIGLSGNTGNSTGPHLHYEIRVNRQAIDPTELTLNRPPRW